MGEPHIIEVFCSCDDIERCVMEKYISDVRILLAEVDVRRDQAEAA